MSEVPITGRGIAPRGAVWFEAYEVGYRDGESNREADAQIYHEEVMCHQPECRCALGMFLAHVGVY